MGSKVYVVHEFGAPSHYEGLRRLLDDGRQEIVFYEFTFIRQLLSSIKHRNLSRFLRSFENLLFFVNLAISKNKKIVIGIAPLDSRLLFVLWFLKKHRVYYHTSWPYWNRPNFPKSNLYQSYILDKWSLFLRKCKHIFVVTNSAKHSLIENSWVCAEKISVVNHSYNESIFNVQQRLKFEKSESQEQLKIVFIGRIEQEKGINEVIEIANLLPSANVTVIGSGTQVHKLKYSKNNNIDFLGYINDKNKIAKVLNESDFLLLPSKRRKDGWEELFGMVIIESMACGCIPFSTNHVGPKEILAPIPYLLTEENSFVSSFIGLVKEINISMTKLKVREVANKYKLNEIKYKWKRINDK